MLSIVKENGGCSRRACQVRLLAVQRIHLPILPLLLLLLLSLLLLSGMCHTVIWDVQYGKIRVKYETAYYTTTPYDTSLPSSMHRLWAYRADKHCMYE